jgi:hypothetical protein
MPSSFKSLNLAGVRLESGRPTSDGRCQRSWLGVNIHAGCRGLVRPVSAWVATSRAPESSQTRLAVAQSPLSPFRATSPGPRSAPIGQAAAPPSRQQEVMALARTCARAPPEPQPVPRRRSLSPSLLRGGRGNPPRVRGPACEEDPARLPPDPPSDRGKRFSEGEAPPPLHRSLADIRGGAYGVQRNPVGAGLGGSGLAGRRPGGSSSL